MSDAIWKPKPKVFIGSSEENLHIARAVKEHLQKDELCECQIWNEDFYEPGDFPVQTLLRRMDEFDFSVLVFGAEDVTIHRHNKSKSPRDNVVFELGICARTHGRDRSFVVKDRDARVLSDLTGLTLAEFNRPPKRTKKRASFRKDTLSAVQKACESLKERIRFLGFRREIVGKVRISFPSLNVPEKRNIFSVRVLRPEETVAITPSLLAMGVESLAEQIRGHHSSIRPSLLVGVNPTGSVMASYLDCLPLPRPPRLVGRVDTRELGGDQCDRELFFEHVPSPDDASRTAPCSPSVIVVDSEYKTGRSLRQICERLKKKFSEPKTLIGKALLCLCGIKIDPGWLEPEQVVDIEKVIEASWYRSKTAGLPTFCPDFVAFLAWKDVEPASGAR